MRTPEEPIEVDKNNSLVKPVLFSMSNLTNTTSLGFSYPYSSWYFNSTVNAENIFPWEGYVRADHPMEGISNFYSNSTDIRLKIEMQYRNIGPHFPLSDTWWSIDVIPVTIGWNYCQTN